MLSRNIIIKAPVTQHAEDSQREGGTREVWVVPGKCGEMQGMFQVE